MENRTEHHYGRNQRLVGNRRERRVSRDGRLLLDGFGHLSLRLSPEDRGRSIHGRIRRVVGGAPPCDHSTLIGRISVASLHTVCFPLLRSHAPASEFECPKLYSVFQPRPCLRRRDLFGNSSARILHPVFGSDVCP